MSWFFDFILYFLYYELMNIFESIKNEFRIPDAYENWSGYRKALTDIIVSHAEKAATDCSAGGSRSAAILGAGPCNDIDLYRIHETYEKITLIDVDSTGMEAALERYGLGHFPQVKVKPVSLTGLTDDLTERFFNRLYMYLVEKGRTLTEADFQERTLMEFKAVEDRLYKSIGDFSEILPEAGYDTIIAAGLHSQLWSVLSYSWHILAGNVSEQLLDGYPVDPEPLHDRIKELDDDMVPLLNEAILRSATGRVILASEYDTDNPVEGAWQCVNHIRSRQRAQAFSLTETTLEWPFSPVQNRKYVMLVQDVVLR